MNKAVPWSIKGVDFDAREAAKEAARRDGLSLGAWMNCAIAERAAETGSDGQEFDADERLEAVAAQLARLSRESEAGDARPARGKGQELHDGDDHALWRPQERPDGRDERASEPPPERARKRAPADWDDPFGGEAEPRRRPARPQPRVAAVAARDTIDPEALLEKAVAAFESRAERAEARADRVLSQVAQRIDSAETERVEMLAQVENRLAGLETHLRRKARSEVDPLRGALAQVAERIDSAETERAEMLSQVESRLADLETHLRKKAHSEVEPLRGALGRLETRLEDLARREPEPRDDETLRKLDRKLSNLISRVERAETAPVGERDEHFARLEKRFDALLAQLDRPAPTRVEAARQEPARQELARQEPARHEPPARPELARATARRPDMRQAIAEVSAHQRALDAAPRPAAEPGPQSAPAHTGAPAPSHVFDERFDVLAKKLERIVQFNAAPQEDRRIDRLQTGIEALSSRIEDMRGEFSALRGAARDQVPPAIEKALRDLAARVEALAAAPPASALKDIAGLRGEVSGLSRSLGDLAPRGAVASLESAMRELANRVESTRSTVERAAQTHDAPDTQDLSRQLAEISRGLHDVAPRGAVAGVESAMRELTSRVESAREIMARASERHLDFAPDLGALNQKLSEIAGGLGDVAPRGAVVGLEDAVRDLSVRVDSARALMERAPAGASAAEIEVLGQQVAAMGRALEDVAPRSQIAALDLAVRDLGARLERSRDEGLRDAVLAPLESLADDMRRAIADIGASANLDGVGRQIAELEEKIEDLRRNGADRSDYLRACDQSDALRASIAAALERMEPLERMERQVAGLTDRLESLSRQSNEVWSAQESGLARNEANWREIGSRLDALAIRIDRAADQRQEPRPDEERRFEEISRRLDFMHQALAERIDGAVAVAPLPGQPGLEPLLRALADRLENAMAPQADARAIEALERQMGQVTERLERGAAHGNMQLQQALADLAARLEQGRQNDRDAAREVARETLREALAHLPVAEGRDEQAAREIAELREKHEHSDRRAQQTLSAVHETLEKVVDRLAMLEEDVQEARATVPAGRAEAARPDALQDAQIRLDDTSRAKKPVYDFDDPDLLLVEPGAGRPMASAPGGHDALETANVRLSREDEAALISGAPSSSNYIEVARRALAARAAADAELQAGEQRNPRGVAAAAERAKEKFTRPLASVEKRAGGRTGMLLAAGASVLAMGMFQLYRVAAPSDSLAPANPAVVEVAPAPAALEAAAPEAAPAPLPAPAPMAAPAPAPAAPATVAPSPFNSLPGRPGLDAARAFPIRLPSAPSGRATPTWPRSRPAPRLPACGSRRKRATPPRSSISAPATPTAEASTATPQARFNGSRRPPPRARPSPNTGWA